MGKGKDCRGLTLIEMLIGMAIIAVLYTAAVPSLAKLITQNRVIAEINELSAIIQFARHQAIDENTVTLLCPTLNFVECNRNWNNPKMVFADLNFNRQRDNDEAILAGLSATSVHNNLYGPATQIRFSESGIVNSPATLTLCDNQNSVQFARAVTVSLQGRVKMSRDTNNDDIYENNAGEPLQCR